MSTSKNTITACIDGSSRTESIIDTAAWASAILAAPLKFLHVIERTSPPVSDRSGAILPGAATDLLDQLTQLDEQRGRVALELGKHMLEEAQRRATEAGVEAVFAQQRHGDLLEALHACEPETQLFVIGRRGEDHDGHPSTLGAHLESLVRGIHTPVIVAINAFNPPDSFMIAYDGSSTANKAIDEIARSKLLQTLPGHVVMIGEPTERNQEQLDGAAAMMTSHGHSVQSHLLPGSVVSELTRFRREHDVGLMVMGAYGHSRVREFFLGSNTSKMISDSTVPLLLLR